MSNWVNKAFKSYFSSAYPRIKQYAENPIEVQQDLLLTLLNDNKHTEYGKKYGFESIKTPQTYADRVPLCDYDDIKKDILRMMHGEQDVLYRGKVKWFSKSSGTTSDKSKYIPVPEENLKQCHVQGPIDTYSLFYHENPNTQLFAGRAIIMGGTYSDFDVNAGTKLGDVSAIMIENMPWYGKALLLPSVKIALMRDLDKKIEAIASYTFDKDVTNLVGVPTWTIVLFRKLLEITGKQNIMEVWPNFQLYGHGGVNFAPYREQFKELLPSENVRYLQAYNASEGYFAAQDSNDSDDMLLFTGNGIYYEFLPIHELGKEHPKTLMLSEVDIDINYALVITTNGGLWRYLPGDTIRFTQKKPYKIQVSGRTKQFINAFGEEVIVENTDNAVAMTCEQTNSAVSDYTVAPIYFTDNNKGGHEWLIEFSNPPVDLELFNKLLDLNLQKLNSDYEAKRYNSLALEQLKLYVLPTGTFHTWLKHKGKYGGQHKVPRLANNRKILDEILLFNKPKPNH